MPHHLPLGHYVDLDTRDSSIVRAFVSEPRTAPKAAIVVLQHRDMRYPAEQGTRHTAPAGLGRTGVNPHVRQMAESFAAAGYLAVCPSTFGRGQSGLDYGYRFETRLWRSGLVKPLQALDCPEVMLDIEAAVAHAHRLSPRQQVFVVGYCWGALLAWRAACELEQVGAAVCHYPGGIEGPQDFQRQPRCPVLLHLPGDGRWMSRQGLQDFIDTQSGPASGLTVFHYEAAYGFMQPEDPAYDEDAARLAHGRTLDFLARQVGKGLLPRLA